ncbi:ATP-binding protein, partial [Mesorhizobium sp. M2D.F.Ca.ET.145.01.1.1]
KPEGGALPSVVERFVTDCMNEAGRKSVPVERVIDERLAHLQEEVGGYDYATVLKAYWRGSEEGDEVLKTSALRWLRGEYSTKTEARQALGVRTIIDDNDIYDALKLLAAFVKLAGYAGLLVVFDEMVNL